MNGKKKWYLYFGHTQESIYTSISFPPIPLTLDYTKLSYVNCIILIDCRQVAGRDSENYMILQNFNLIQYPYQLRNTPITYSQLYIFSENVKNMLYAVGLTPSKWINLSSTRNINFFHVFGIFWIAVQYNIKHTLYVPQAIIFLDNYDRKPQNCNILWTSSHTYIKTSGWHIRICLLSFILAFPIHLMSSTVSDIYSWLLKIA